MTTALDIITDALVKLGVYAPNESLTATDIQQGLTSLNDMISQWADEYLYVSTGQPTTINLLIGTASYTIGPAGAINQIRPSQITYGIGQATATVAATPSPVNVVSAIEWNNIYSKTPGVGTPSILFYDPQYPLGVLNVAPTPSAVGTLVFQAWVPFTAFPDDATVFTFVPGIVDLMKTNLAIVLKPYFAMAAIDPIIVVQASRDKDMFRYTNLSSRALIGRVPKQAAG